MIKIEDIVLDGKESNSSGRQMPAMTDEEKDILQHHGVIGMRWGKGRKTKVPKQTVAPKAKGVNEAAREQQFKSEYANRDKMSTRSLQNRVKRLQAEQQFKELVNKPAAERAKAAAAIAEKKRKRNKMLLRTALGIYGNVPMESFGKKGKDLKEILGPSQAIAKAATSSAALKNSAINDETENVLLHYGIKEEEKYMTINKNDVILHSSTGVELQDLHHGFKYKSKHQNKKGKWVYIYDDVKENVGDLFDKNATVNISKKVNTDYSGKDLSNAIKSIEKSANKSISGNSYDKSKTYTKSIDSIKPIGKGLTKKITGTVNVRKKGTIHKTYDSVLKKIGF